MRNHIKAFIYGCGLAVVWGMGQIGIAVWINFIFGGGITILV